MSFVPHYEFTQCVKRYGGNYRVRSFSCWDQFLCMVFAQLTCRESLRDIETCLRVMQSKLYHLGIRGKVSRSTLADANETRDWRIYADFARLLIDTARRLYAKEEFGVQLEQTVYALDCTTVNLCLSLFPWARYREKNAAIKIHTLLDLRGSIPSFIKVTPARVHEIHILDELVPEPGSIYIMDRAYLDFSRLYTLTQGLAFFVIRARKPFLFQRLYSHPVQKSSGLRCDQTIVLKGLIQKKGYPEKLRRIRYRNVQTDKQLVFLTNNFHLSALTITQLYQCRWQVELFFKWIKQHLRIKYVLIAIVRKRLEIKASLYTILQILGVTLFEKTPLSQVLTERNYNNEQTQNCNQLSFNDF